MYLVYEDASLGVVYKPKGLKTTREHAQQKESAQEEAAKLLSLSAEVDALPVPLACYTLDSAVEGLLVMAKTSAAKTRCESAEVSLRFQALISGRVQSAVSVLRSGRDWLPRGGPNKDHLSRRQHRNKNICVAYNTKGCHAQPDGSNPLHCRFRRLHSCAGCGGEHPFSSCPEAADVDIQTAAAVALAQTLEVVPPDIRLPDAAVRPTTSMRLDSTTRCMGGDTFISAVELCPSHGFHCISIFSEQLLAAGHHTHPHGKFLKGSYRGLFLACTGVTVPAVVGCLAPLLELDVPAPVRFERLVKKEEGFFAADRLRAEAELEACGFPPLTGLDSGGATPVQYQTGLALFCGRRYRVTPDVLIPRPCYEPIVAAALQHLRPDAKAYGPLSDTSAAAAHRQLAILDIGCGSGCLLLACLAELPHASGVGLDICPKALQVGKSNAELFGETERCDWLQLDYNYLPQLSERFPEGFDAIVFNPPYLERSAWLSTSCLAEPDLALFVDEKYDAYRAVESGLRQCRSMGRPLLREGGLLAIGLGSGHCATVRDIYESQGEFRCEDVLTDPQGIKRCIALLAV